MEDQEKKPEANQPKKNNTALYATLAELGIEFAFIIALPLIAFIYIGRWLDGKTGHHFFVIIGILLAIGLSSYMIYRKILEAKKMLK